MRAPNFGKLNTDKMTRALQNGLNALAKGGFKKLFNHIDQTTIKKGVDEMGINKFINHCALLAAGSGAASGVGGLATLVVGTPLDMLNLVMQQFRVTMAIRYHNTGVYKINFVECFRLVASSLKVDAGVTITKTIMEKVAGRLMLVFGEKAAGRLVPVVGAVIGGTANYMFIKRVAGNLMIEPVRVWV
ncbi:hypothetical protein GCM10027049_12610 [Mucilaginibacter puniceus]